MNVWRKTSLPPWVLDGWPHQCQYLPTLDYWYTLLNDYDNAHAEAEQYVRNNSKRFEQNAARARIKSDMARRSALQRYQDLDKQLRGSAAPDPIHKRYEPPPPEAPAAPLDELPLTLRLAIERKRAQQAEQE